MIVGILGSSGCGGTFLDWTINYLSGATAHWTMYCDLNRREPNPAFHASHQPWIDFARCTPVPDNPLLAQTAHRHAKTHPTRLTLPRVLQAFAQHNPDPVQTFYYFDNLDADNPITQHNKIIAQYPQVKFIPYTYTSHSVDIIFCMQLEKLPAMIDLYAEGLDTDPWTRRELLSLSYPSMIAGQTTAETILPHANSHSLNFDDFFYRLPDCMPQLFEYLGLTIDPVRWPGWLAVYQQYQKNNNTDFFQNLDYIVECIVKNNKIDLSIYNMTFAKQVVLASKLLYNYNYTLKAQGLAEIGNCTQQWHSVLETNTYHKLNKEIT